MFITNTLVGVWMALLLCPLFVFADSSVVNNISVYTTTGGNTISNGTVKTGSSSASVNIKTVINGETVVDIHETSTGEPIVIEDTHTTNNQDAVVTTDIHLNATSNEEEPFVPNTNIPVVRYEEARMAEGESFSPSSTITKINDELTIDEAVTREEHSLAHRIIDSFARTIQYVLSFFS